MASKCKTLVKIAFTLSISIFGSNVMAAGALAIDSNQGSQYGFAHGYSNIGQAEQRALNECGNGCQVVLTFPSGCGAYAADQAENSTAYGWATGSNAQNRAISECQSRGGTSCIVRAWACD